MSLLPDSQTLLAELVSLPGPPGQENAVRAALNTFIAALGLTGWTDEKGNLLVGSAGIRQGMQRPRILVTAHLDEIAAMVTGVEADGILTVAPLGGTHPYKWGEGPVEILGGYVDNPVLVPGVFSFGSIHTTSPLSVIQQTREGRAVTWEMARVYTGLSSGTLRQNGVRPGCRVVIARSRRNLWTLGGNLIASYFLDDRADLVSWLLTLQEIPLSDDVLFAATASEEVGGEGAQYIMQQYRPDICVALEIGPLTPDSRFPLDAMPTVWVSDSYAATSPRDLELLERVALLEGLSLHWQVVTRGGSDASCAASRGLCARPVTIAFAAENSHGFEIMHRDAPGNLANLLRGYLKHV